VKKESRGNEEKRKVLKDIRNLFLLHFSSLLLHSVFVAHNVHILETSTGITTLVKLDIIFAFQFAYRKSLVQLNAFMVAKNAHTKTPMARPISAPNVTCCSTIARESFVATRNQIDIGEKEWRIRRERGKV
jgi:hypothetical protein